MTLIDHQPQMLFGINNIDRQMLISHTAALAKAAKVFHVPMVLPTIETKPFGGYLWPRLAAVSLDLEPIERIGRKEIVMARLWTEVCITFRALRAMEAGYMVYVAIDAGGAVNRMLQDMAMLHMVQAGAVPMRWSLVPLEFQREWARKETYDAVIDIVKQHAEAHGVGAEAYSMQQYTIAPNAAVGFPLSGRA
jgi:nicotinamidase-related amidase